jgi:hypothetical protein
MAETNYPQSTDAIKARSEAFIALKNFIVNDPEYAWLWQCNLAMAADAERIDIHTANRIGHRFMRMVFGVEPTEPKSVETRFLIK